jgi:hypothetical protein
MTGRCTRWLESVLAVAGVDGVRPLRAMDVIIWLTDWRRRHPDDTANACAGSRLTGGANRAAVAAGHASTPAQNVRVLVSLAEGANAEVGS